MDRTPFMRRAIELSCSAIDRPGAPPYGAVIVKDGGDRRLVGEAAAGGMTALNSDETEADSARWLHFGDKQVAGAVAGEAVGTLIAGRQRPMRIPSGSNRVRLGT